MIKIIGVRCRNMDKLYYFEQQSLNIKMGDSVIVETSRGVEYAMVVLGPKEVEESNIMQPLKKIIRVATSRDRSKEENNRRKEKEAFQICLKKVAERKLYMKLINAEYIFDNSKMLFHFTADGRVDFRELVKDLAAVLKTRIELRQIGVRDKTKILGGIGICGRSFCCYTYLSDFASVSIKMAKDQHLSLNSTKISGNCGRLMCCLQNEQAAYLNKTMPNNEDIVITPEGLKGKVQSVSVLRQTVKILVEVNDEKEIREYRIEELKMIPCHQKQQKNKDKTKKRTPKELKKNKEKQ